MTATGYPAKPLLDLVRAGRPWHQAGACPYCDRNGDPRSSANCVSTREIANELHVAHETVQRWKTGGNVRTDLVDDVAVAAGVHPGEIWPEWWAWTPPKRNRPGRARRGPRPDRYRVSATEADRVEAHLAAVLAGAGS